MAAVFSDERMLLRTAHLGDTVTQASVERQRQAEGATVSNLR